MPMEDTYGIQPRIGSIIVVERWYCCRGSPVFSDRNIHYPQEKAKKSTIRRQIDVSLDELTDEELKIIQGTIDGIMKYKGTGSK